MGVSEQFAAQGRARAQMDAALTHYVEVLARHALRGSAGDSAELARLRAAHQVRAELVELGEHQVDQAIEAARQRQPCGHSWADIGHALGGISSQAAGRRARGRGLDTTRSWSPSHTTLDRAAQTEQHRAQRVVTAAFIDAAGRWPGRRLRRVDHDDGTVTFEPIHPQRPKGDT